MSEDRYLRLTIDIAVFDERVVDLLRDELMAPEEKGHPHGTGEKLAREFMDAIKRGAIEIDDIRNVEDHS